MDDFESHLRSALSRNADRASIPVGIGERAETAAVKHRRRARMATAGSVLAVASVVAITAAVTRPITQVQAPVDAPVADGQGETASPKPGYRTLQGWRSEYWGEVAVDVPADWGYDAGITQRAWCSDGPLDAAGARVDSVSGWVGRPVMLSDACDGDSEHIIAGLIDRAVPFVIFDTGMDIDEGPTEHGFVIETIARGSTTLTVGWSDRSQRDQIVASIRTNDSGCPSTYDTDAGPGPSDAIGSATAFRVCAYDIDSFTATLSYVAVKAVGDPGVTTGFQKFVYAIDHGSRTIGRLARQVDGQAVLIDTVDGRYLLRTDAGVILTPDGGDPIDQITEPMVAPWAEATALSTVVWTLGTGKPWELGYVRGILG